ncbi:hypothetical protein A0H76_2549 [Hepatospora eriocheir]|uniref:Uncharacterized protein n=1 Tax=Hepatospora eriocheir TaxID=1081669 RepID=A0A1X0QJQ5_9MICR|nr:hypothetical protein A0H76_2549 [Hepatospora eriocheir]
MLETECPRFTMKLKMKAGSNYNKEYNINNKGDSNNKNKQYDNYKNNYARGIKEVEREREDSLIEDCITGEDDCHIKTVTCGKRDDDNKSQVEINEENIVALIDIGAKVLIIRTDC